jgi:hypothetical protein
MNWPIVANALHWDTNCMSSHRIGVMYDRALPAQGLVEFARAAEATGRMSYG